MRVNNISDTPVNNKQNFGAIKKIKLSSLYANKPELTDDILYVYLHKSFENTQEFLKRYDVNVTLNAQPKELPPPKDIWESLDDFFGERRPTMCQHSIEFEIIPQNSVFLNPYLDGTIKSKLTHLIGLGFYVHLHRQHGYWQMVPKK